MTTWVAVSYSELAEDGMPEILRCICCEKEIRDINKALVLPGRVQTYIGPCCKEEYLKENETFKHNYD